jgi:hypothetical protein
LPQPLEQVFHAPNHVVFHVIAATRQLVRELALRRHHPHDEPTSLTAPHVDARHFEACTTRGSERDAAQLARAQLLASQGRTGEALALASELAQHGSSQVVREKARDLSTRVQQSAAADRSFPPAPAINQP